MAAKHDRSSEQFYRVLDGLYRVHDDLYYIEDAVLRSTLAQVRLSRLTAQTRLGAAAGALLVGIPILVAVSPIDWTSASLWWVVIAGLALLVFLFWQVREASKAASELQLAERLSEKAPLKRRLDYQLESINANAHRIRVVEEVLEDLEEAVEQAEPSLRLVLERRLSRYGEIRSDCADAILRVVKSSWSMVQTEARSAEDHETVLDWASPYLQPDDLARYRSA